MEESIFAVLADTRRRQIVELLAASEHTVSELCEHFEISQPAVSRHLRVLREAGLVSCRAEAQSRVYRLEPRPLEQIDRWLEKYRSFWRLRLGDLEASLLSERQQKGRT